MILDDPCDLLLGSAVSLDHRFRNDQCVRWSRTDLAKDSELRFLRAVVFAPHDIAKGKRPERGPNGQEADDHAKIADAIDDERLVGGIRGAFALDVKAD